jgi:secondary thiamine-phosphate synthase enzyme
MSWFQKQFTLPAKSRGSYLITDQVVSSLPEIRDYKVGLLNLFVQHTSCALSLNENWDSDVREDMSDALDRIAPAEGPKGEALYRHDAEGPDDMPAHIKSALIGASVTIPIKDGKLVSTNRHFLWLETTDTAIGYWNLARNLVSRVPRGPSSATSRCNYSGRKGLEEIIVETDIDV